MAHLEEPMFVSFALAFLPIVQDAPTKVSRLRPLRVEDALFAIPGIGGRVVAGPDLDEDGVPDLVVERGSRSSAEPWRIAVLSTRTGRELVELWSFGTEFTPHRPVDGGLTWDHGGDVDGDGVGDLVVGLWRPSSDQPGAGVAVVSGADGSLIHTVAGADPGDGFGFSVAFLGDVDGDGRADFAVGAPQVKVGWSVLDRRRIASTTLTRSGDSRQTLFKLRDGSTRTAHDFAQESLDARGQRAGYVSVRSGRDGKELLRIDGTRKGHGFGTRVVAVGDLDADGVPDVGILPASESETEVLLYSVARRSVIARLPNLGGSFGSAGDVDGDTVPDLFQMKWDLDAMKTIGPVHILCGKTGKELWRLRTPDGWSEYTWISAGGDLDGDGRSDVLIGSANFNLLHPSLLADPIQRTDLSKISLRDVVNVPNRPHVGGSWESGCVWIYAGVEPSIVLGIYGEPGTTHGLGLWVTPFPDVDGDGLPDLLVATEDTAYVFAGPGRP